VCHEYSITYVDKINAGIFYLHPFVLKYSMPKKTNGKQKGNSFERKIANLLSDRFQTYLGVETGFRRNSDSGSYFGGTNKTRTETHNLDYAIFGDLICPTDFRYVVECKHYKSPPSWQAFVDGTVKQWDDWIAQNDQDSISAKKPGVLIIKYNNVSELLFSQHHIEQLRPCFIYQTRYVYRLSDWLTLPDNQFFY